MSRSNPSHLFKGTATARLLSLTPILFFPLTGLFQSPEKKDISPILAPPTAKLSVRAVYARCLRSLCSGCPVYHPLGTAPVKVTSGLVLRNPVVSALPSFDPHQQHFRVHHTLPVYSLSGLPGHPARLFFLRLYRSLLLSLLCQFLFFSQTSYY